MTSESDLSLTTHAKSSFDPALFSFRFYGGSFPDETAGKIFDWLIKQFHDIFNGGMLKGKQLLDIGTGPVVHPVVTASKWFDKIYLSDFSSSNIEFLQRWRRGQSRHMEYLMKSFAQMEGNGGTWETLNQRVLGKVKDVVKCDVNRPNPLSETILEDAKFDVITSCNCLQVATLTAEAFEKALRNIRYTERVLFMCTCKGFRSSTLLKPGGHLVVVNFLDETYYKVGAKKFQALSLTSEELQRAFKNSGFVIERLTMWTYGPVSVVNDGTTIYSVVAKRRS